MQLDDDDLPLPCEDSCTAVITLRQENHTLHEHIRAANQATAISQELVIQQFREVERVMSLLQKENALRKSILDAASQISIIYCDLDGTIRLFNQGSEQMLGIAADEVVDQRAMPGFLLPDELASAGGLRGLAEAARRHVCRNREWHYLARGGQLIPVLLSISAVLDENDEATGLMLAATDISEAKAAEASLRDKNRELASLLEALQETQQQLLQSEKMASLGQLAAGVAHEINNPIGFVSSNLGTLSNYSQQLFKLIGAYEKAETLLDSAPEARQALEEAKLATELDYLKDDLVALIDESRDGLRRVSKIVQDLKTFAHMGDAEWEWGNLHAGIESTLNLAWGELKSKAEIEKHYGDLPAVYCVPSQLNQVFMNILVNAAHAIAGKGTISIATACDGTDFITVAITDTGTGIATEHLQKIFDPFFTTKPVGSGTGLGLYLSFNIVKKHQGEILVASEPGRGTTFTVRLPILPMASQTTHS
jgi:two-component system NtrC family sensor kinase